MISHDHNNAICYVELWYATSSSKTYLCKKRTVYRKAVVVLSYSIAYLVYHSLLAMKGLLRRRRYQLALVKAYANLKWRIELDGFGLIAADNDDCIQSCSLLLEFNTV
jgi:hypothetical protein